MSAKISFDLEEGADVALVSLSRSSGRLATEVSLMESAREWAYAAIMLPFLLFCGRDRYWLLAVGIKESGRCLVVTVCSRRKWDLEAWSALNGVGILNRRGVSRRPCSVLCRIRSQAAGDDISRDSATSSFFDPNLHKPFRASLGLTHSVTTRYCVKIEGRVHVEY